MFSNRILKRKKIKLGIVFSFGWTMKNKICIAKDEQIRPDRQCRGNESQRRTEKSGLGMLPAATATVPAKKKSPAVFIANHCRDFGMYQLSWCGKCKNRQEDEVECAE